MSCHLTLREKKLPTLYLRCFSGCVPPPEIITIKLPPSLKAEFSKAIRESGDFATATKFVESAIMAFVLQSKRGERFSIPIEFVSTKAAIGRPAID